MIFKNIINTCGTKVFAVYCALLIDFQKIGQWAYSHGQLKAELVKVETEDLVAVQ